MPHENWRLTPCMKMPRQFSLLCCLLVGKGQNGVCQKKGIIITCYVFFQTCGTWSKASWLLLHFKTCFHNKKLMVKINNDTTFAIRVFFPSHLIRTLDPQISDCWFLSCLGFACHHTLVDGANSFCQVFSRLC